MDELSTPPTAARMFISKVWNELLNLILPEMCVQCGKIGNVLCVHHLYNLPSPTKMPYPYCHALFHYRTPPIRTALQRLKYRRARSVANVFSAPLAHRISQLLRSIPMHGTPVLIPVPITPARTMRRGYNQSEILCRATARYLANVHIAENILIKYRETPSQTSRATRSERFQNVRNAYLVRDVNHMVHGRTIILIDDIITTGATMNECRNTLMRAGAATVICVAVAH